MERGGLALALGVRDGECRFAGLEAVKETIVAVEQMNSVSMPSAVSGLFLAAGVDVDRMAGRAGSVNERRAVVDACGACSKTFLEAGTDMVKCFCFKRASSAGPGATGSVRGRGGQRSVRQLNGAQGWRWCGSG
jgi:hypothetical protein